MKKLKNLLLLACVTASLAVPANAAGLEYSFDGADGPDYASATSIEVIHTANGGARANVDISKNAALIPPAFGSASMDALNTGMYLTPNLAPGGMAVGTVNGSNAIVYPPIYSGNIIIPGSSAVFCGACVTYTNEIKIKLLGVDPAVIEAHTEVSDACAAAMAEGARQAFGTDVAYSTTGYAGPGGGTEKDPVGTVYIAISTAKETVVHRLSLPQDWTRDRIRREATRTVLEKIEVIIATETETL